MMRPYIIAVYAYLSVAQLAMAVSISNMYEDQNRTMRNAIIVKSDGTQEHDSKPGAQEVLRSKKKRSQGNVDTARNPGDASLKQAEEMLELSEKWPANPPWWIADRRCGERTTKSTTIREKSGNGPILGTTNDCCYTPFNIKKGNTPRYTTVPVRNLDEIQTDGEEKGPRKWLDEKGPYDYKHDSRLCFPVHGHGCKSAMEILEDGDKSAKSCGMIQRESRTHWKKTGGPTPADVKQKLCEGISGKCEWCKKSRKGLWQNDTLEMRAKWKSAWANKTIHPKSAWASKTISEDAYFGCHCEMCTFHACKCKNDCNNHVVVTTTCKSGKCEKACLPPPPPEAQVALLAQAPPPAYGAAPLPPGWEVKKAPDGKPYYEDDNTKTTHWERSAAPAAPPAYGASF